MMASSRKEGVVSVPIGIELLPTVECINRNKAYKLFIMVSTFLCYSSYHLSRKPISVVKNVLHHNSSNSSGWAPFDEPDYKTLLGSLDYAFLFTYAVGMFLSGHVAERVNLRYFLSCGMLLSGILTAAFGFGYFFNIHSLTYYIFVQIFCGLFQASGWPSVVTYMGNWFGKGNRGLIMGIWNSHTSVGNILGSVIAGEFVETNWGWSFVAPGIIIGAMGIFAFLFMIHRPEFVQCTPPEHAEKSQNKYIQSSETEPLVETEEISSGKAISFFEALKIPGVVEFSLCLFFAKLISYTFLYWLPNFIKNKTHLNAQRAANLSTFFDTGGIIGGICAGFLSDKTKSSGIICMIMSAFAAPLLYIYNAYGAVNYTWNIVLLIICGVFVNGPYALITTAVSADLGTHQCLEGNTQAIATVTSIIDGTGSMGAALGPLLTGILSQRNWNYVFYMLIAADAFAFLVSIVITFRINENKLALKYIRQHMPFNAAGRVIYIAFVLITLAAIYLSYSSLSSDFFISN
ncbi:glucose-6-phosphate exchanger SLC37A2-like isoform X1 [Octopus vulgaris]|uniref:Sugar phosphate exchanger 3 n=1 Tax=Octopus vulgaris TaxID=6645 RepID=A0AA36F3E8_OCTVU|nr:glucose-6-phosphate exchanger SLC37A2-like isoform X1 [Octopus vulgaris]